MINFDEYIWGDKFKAEFKSDLYCNIDFVCDRLPKTNKVVITHNGDNPVSCDKVNYFSHLTSWFGQNVMCDDNRVHPLPIGLENDYIGGSPERKKRLHAISNINRIPTKLVYLNCSIGTHRLDRQGAYDWFGDKKWTTAVSHGTRNYGTYCTDIQDHEFCICPRGNGLDCHRNWEVLYLDRYLVMKKYHGLEKLYSDLPVVFVDDWNQVTEEFLKHKLEEMKKTSYNMEKLKFSYWKSMIKEYL